MTEPIIFDLKNAELFPLVYVLVARKWDSFKIMGVAMSAGAVRSQLAEYVHLDEYFDEYNEQLAGDWNGSDTLSVIMKSGVSVTVYKHHQNVITNFEL